MHLRKALAGAILLVSTVFAVLTHAQSSRFDELANAPFTNGFLSKETIASLKDELVFQRAVQSYLLLWVITRFRMVVGHIAATELLDAADLAHKV